MSNQGYYGSQPQQPQPRFVTLYRLSHKRLLGAKQYETWLGVLATVMAIKRTQLTCVIDDLSYGPPQGYPQQYQGQQPVCIHRHFPQDSVVDAPGIIA